MSRRDDYWPYPSARRNSYGNLERNVSTGVPRYNNVTRKVGPGKRCRVTVETGGKDSRKDPYNYESYDYVPTVRPRVNVYEDEDYRSPLLRSRSKRREERRERDRVRPLAALPDEKSDYDLGERPSSEPDRYPRRQSPSSAASSDDEPASSYDFDLESSSVQPATLSSDLEFSIADSAPSGGVSRSSLHHFNGSLVTKRIVRSRWLGDTFERGDLSGEITVDNSSSSANVSSEKGSSSAAAAAPLIRWHHLERSMMSFEEFMTAAESVLQVRERFHRNVVRLLRDVQRKYEQQRQNGRAMDPNCISDTFFSDVNRPDRETASVKFIAFPYHCLAPYDLTQLRALAPGSPLHPLRPMLQDFSNSTSEKRELAQATTSVLDENSNECLHISEVWCLVVNNDTMITCSRLSFEVLCGNTITQSLVPASSTERRGPMVKVTGSIDRTWLIPVTPTTTWPAFLSLFEDIIAVDGDMSTQCLRFESSKGVIDGSKWAHIVNFAGATPIELQLKIIVPQPKLPYFDSSRGADAPFAKAEPGDPSAPLQEWAGEPGSPELPSAPPKPLPKIGLRMFQQNGLANSLSLQADRLHEVLLSNPRSQEQTAYAECPSATLADIDNWLFKPGSKGGQASNSKSQDKLKLKLAITVKMLFNLFWPQEFSHPMLEKFWGALYEILSREDGFFKKGSRDPRDDSYAAGLILQTLHTEVLPAILWLTGEFESSKNDLNPLPDNFSKAWLHFMTGLVLVAQQPLNRHVASRDSPITKHFEATATELNEGLRVVSTRLQFATLEDLELCTVNSLVALLLSRLSKDIMNGRPSVDSIYARYYQNLEFKIIENPAPRSHQEKLRFFLQEVEAILNTLEHQLDVLDILIKSLDASNNTPGGADMPYFNPYYKDSKARPAVGAIYNTPGAAGALELETLIGPSRQSTVLAQTRAELASKINNFRGLQSQAQSTGEWHRNAIETNKDRQEAAIMVFTIVTIIFLPLSFVSSVFGMNSKDIRNMKLNQWAYWAAALPVTFVVVVGSLWWAGFGDGVGEWLESTLKIGSGRHRRRGVTIAGASGYQEVRGGRDIQAEIRALEQERRDLRRSREAFDNADVEVATKRPKAPFYPRPHRRRTRDEEPDV